MNKSNYKTTKYFKSEHEKKNGTIGFVVDKQNPELATRTNQYFNNRESSAISRNFHYSSFMSCTNFHSGVDH